MSKGATAQELAISWATVDRYWNMTIETYEEAVTRQFISGLDKHQGVILDWLKSHEDLSAAQIQDWLMEHYQEGYKERTVRNYVQRQRILHHLPRKKPGRDYNSVPELPPGQQLQADFGEYWAIRQDMRRIKLYFVVFILAHSRYKYILWKLNPFTALDFTLSLERCFEAIGGIPEELVIDQDRLMVVQENYGDILYTREFERCKQWHGFRVRLCRKGDPESKGMIESGVKFVKYNFARYRLFITLEQWSSDSVEWLVRTGNGKVHAETKRIPAEVFLTEQPHLRPVKTILHPPSNADRITTPVRKNNTIRYKSCRYSVPSGTYLHCPEVQVREKDGYLEIFDKDGQQIVQAPLGVTPGELVRNNHHGRDITAHIQDLMTEARNALGNSPAAEVFLQKIQKTRGRYIRDQLQLILAVAGKYPAEIVQHALQACQACGSNAATDFRDFACHQFRQMMLDKAEPVQTIQPVQGIPSARMTGIRVSQHDPAIYQRLMTREEC